MKTVALALIRVICALAPLALTPRTLLAEPAAAPADLAALEATFTDLHDSARTIRLATGWTFTGLGAGVATLGTFAFNSTWDAMIADQRYQDPPEEVARLQRENNGLAFGLGVGIGSAFLLPGVLILVIPTDDEAIPDAYFAATSADEAPAAKRARARDALQAMAASARVRRLATAWSFAAFGAAGAISLGASAFSQPEHDRPSMWSAAGASLAIYGGVAAWQLLTTWDAEDAWAAHQGGDATPAAARPTRWALTPAITPDGGALLSFSLCH